MTVSQFMSRVFMFGFYDESGTFFTTFDRKRPHDEVNTELAGRPCRFVARVGNGCEPYSEIELPRQTARQLCMAVMRMDGLIFCARERCGRFIRCIA